MRRNYLKLECLLFLKAIIVGDNHDRKGGGGAVRASSFIVDTLQFCLIKKNIWVGEIWDFWGFSKNHDSICKFWHACIWNGYGSLALSSYQHCANKW